MNASIVKTADDLDTLRHDSAHLPAQAVKELYPVTQVAIGLAIENRFYYDFAFAEPLSAALSHTNNACPTSSCAANESWRSATRCPLFHRH